MISCPQAGLAGVEPDPAALAIARRKFGAGADLIRWHNGFLDTLDLTARWQPNKIVSSLVFHQVPLGEKRAILEQMHDLLQPGGMVLIADYMAQDSALMRKLFRATVQQLDGVEGPVIASTDYMKLYADQIRQWVPAPYKVLGTDGFGRSDSRRKLRQFFEVDRHWVAYTALSALVEQGKLKPKVLTDALKAFGIDPAKTNPLDC